MRVLVLGGDGYLGWPTASAPLGSRTRGHGRRQPRAARYDVELGTSSLVPISDLERRTTVWNELTGRRVTYASAISPTSSSSTSTFQAFMPDAIVHFGEQRSAPYSMIDRSHAVYTQVNNVVGNLNLLFAIGEIDPSIHLVKLGTMGEYGTPNIDIEEGFIEITHKGRTDTLAVPEATGVLLPPVEGARLAQHRVRLSRVGAARDRPQPGHRLRPGRPTRPCCTPTSRPASTTTPCSARCSTASSCRPSPASPLTVYGKGTRPAAC